MPRSWRWAVVAGVSAAFAALPAALAAIPAGHSDLSAATLLRMVQNSGSVAYSGYAESTGGLALPVTSQFTSVADLFGGQTQLRVWWRTTNEWRVDAIGFSGESDTHQDGNADWTWNYESDQATLVENVTNGLVRLPASVDLLPTTLARRMLSEATPAQVQRLPDERIAGRDVPGLRLQPSDPGSTIDRVDVWVDPRSGAALRVDVHGAGTTVVSTQFLDFSAATPPSSVLTFDPPAGAHLRTTADPDLLALIDRVARIRPPATLGGLARNPQLPAVGSVGVYGQGVTEFAATPLFGRTANSLRRQLNTTPGVVTTDAGQSLAVGPLTLVLTGPLSSSSDPDGDFGTSWLLTGTVTPAELATAAAQLIADAP